MKVTEEVYRGLDCIRLSNRSISAWLTKSVGLRVIGLGLESQEDLLAHLPQAAIELPDDEDYQLRGGHRLWYAPERPESTYVPDNQPVETVIGEEQVDQIQPVDRPTGIQKAWTIQLDETDAQVTLEHRLSNRGESLVRLAPWAITMLRPGGVGILPQQLGKSDEHGLLPNRHLVLWPYTRMASPHILWGDKAVFVEAELEGDALKIGLPNPSGWLAYCLEGMLFVKKAGFEEGAEYIDRGASSEVYCSPEFIELETLGPVVELGPGESLVHQEQWQVYPEGKWEEEILDRYEDYQQTRP